MNSSVFCSAVALATLLVASPALGYTVIIDPGHGGKDGGASHAHALESSLTLDTCRRFAGELQRRGIPYVFTRTSDRFVSLNARRNVSKRYKDSVFVSIHFNASTNTKAHGIETFYRSAASRPLAAAVQSTLIRQTRATNRGVKSRGFTVITNNPARAAILVEGGFLSNPAERRRCQSASYRQLLANAIANGLVQTMGTVRRPQAALPQQHYAATARPQRQVAQPAQRWVSRSTPNQYVSPPQAGQTYVQQQRQQWRPPHYIQQQYFSHGNVMVMQPQSAASHCRPERTPFGWQDSCRSNKRGRRR